MAELLLCENVYKSFGGKRVLQGLNLQVSGGRIVGLLGPNGSGKTTLMKLINGLLVPNQGKNLVNGFAPGPESKKRVSYLPDASYLPDWMQVQDLVKMFADFYADFDAAKAAEMLQTLKISGTERLKTLSKGTKEKVQLILAMSRRAELYLLDEPIGGVDPAARDYILNTIIGNYSENATVILSTHLIADIEQVLDEAVFLRDGRIMLHKSVDEIRAEDGKSVDDLFREVFRC